MHTNQTKKEESAHEPKKLISQKGSLKKTRESPTPALCEERRSGQVPNDNPGVPLDQILGTPCSREEALQSIRQDWETWQTFQSFPAQYQEKILHFLQGQSGIQIIYDSFFKYVMNPEKHPERFESFLSALLGQTIHIQQVLTPEGNHLACHGSLVIMDVIVELADGSIVDVEMQKIGYAFPGERSCCYVSDMIMRQYNRIHSREGNHFSYHHMKPVYLIILMEQSLKQFQKAAPDYLHHRISSYDTGIDLPDLDRITYISLDVFRKKVQNIDTRLEAWLTFLSAEESERIIRLIRQYPEFLSCYQDIIEFRKDPKELITMFSEALRIMDENTALYMIDEQKKEIAECRQIILEQNNALAERENAIAERDHAIAECENAIAERDHAIVEQNHAIAELKAKLAKYENG